MGILQDLPPPIPIGAGAHRIHHIHEAVQVDGSGDGVGVEAEHQRDDRHRQLKVHHHPSDDVPDGTELQTQYRQAGQHQGAGCLVPYPPGVGNGAEHAAAHSPSLQDPLHSGSPPL